MTEHQKATMRDMLLCHREAMLERAVKAERIARACRAVAEKDAAMIADLSSYQQHPQAIDRERQVRVAIEHGT